MASNVPDEFNRITQFEIDRAANNTAFESTALFLGTITAAGGILAKLSGVEQLSFPSTVGISVGFSGLLACGGVYVNRWLEARHDASQDLVAPLLGHAELVLPQHTLHDSDIDLVAADQERYNSSIDHSAQEDVAGNPESTAIEARLPHAVPEQPVIPETPPQEQEPTDQWFWSKWEQTE